MSAENIGIKDQVWRDKAPCYPATQANPDMANAWITEEAFGSKKARRICLTECAVREECLRDAVQDEESDGWRGGFYFEYGAVVKKDAKAIQEEFPDLAPRVRRVFKEVDTGDYDDWDDDPEWD